MYKQKCNWKHQIGYQTCLRCEAHNNSVKFCEDLMRTVFVWTQVTYGDSTILTDRLTLSVKWDCEQLINFTIKLFTDEIYCEDSNNWIIHRNKPGSFVLKLNTAKLPAGRSCVLSVSQLPCVADQCVDHILPLATKKREKIITNLLSCQADTVTYR